MKLLFFKVQSALSENKLDIIFLIGISAFGTGMWWIDPAWSLIAVGLMFVLIGILGALK